MITRLLFCTFFALFVCTGCGLIYKQNIQQGNAIEQDDLDELYEGMSKRQVLFVLGTPSIMDPFHHDRWDYVQTFSRRGGDLVQRTVTIHFKDDLLTDIVGRDDPFGVVSGGTGDDSDSDSGEVASFVKKPDSQAESGGEPTEPTESTEDEVATFVKKPETIADPNEAAVESAKEEILNPDPDIDYIDERTYEDREYERDQELLDQTPDDGIPGPDIDG